MFVLLGEGKIKKMKKRNTFFAGIAASILCLNACGDNVTAISDNGSTSETGASTVPETGLPTEAMCGNTPYNPMEKICAGVASDANGEPIPFLFSLCGSMLYNPEESSNQNPIMDLALGLLFESKQVCRDGVVYGICGEQEYNVITHFCYESVPYEFCGGQRYAPDDQVCENGKVRGVCGDKKIVYDFETQTCRDGKIYNWCGSKRYDSETQGCLEQDSTVYTNP